MKLSKKEAAPYERWVEVAKKLGAAEAKVIAAASVVTGRWVRLKCQFGCGGYGQRLTCPPHSPTPEETAAVLAEYRVALLVHNPSRGNWKPLKKVVVALEREIFLAGHYKALGFGCGPCDLCSSCNLESCEHPERARPSMEAAGIDVYATARGNGFPIEVVRTPSSPQNYYGLVLIE
jgi:predicted metal-binding protein